MTFIRWTQICAEDVGLEPTSQFPDQQFSRLPDYQLSQPSNIPRFLTRMFYIVLAHKLRWFSIGCLCHFTSFYYECSGKLLPVKNLMREEDSNLRRSFEPCLLMRQVRYQLLNPAIYFYLYPRQESNLQNLEFESSMYANSITGAF